jgi:hypothetical protein
MSSHLARMAKTRKKNMKKRSRRQSESLVDVETPNNSAETVYARSPTATNHSTFCRSLSSPLMGPYSFAADIVNESSRPNCFSDHYSCGEPCLQNQYDGVILHGVRDRKQAFRIKQWLTSTLQLSLHSATYRPRLELAGNIKGVTCSSYAGVLETVCLCTQTVIVLCTRSRHRHPPAARRGRSVGHEERARPAFHSHDAR